MKSIIPIYGYIDKNCIRSSLSFTDFDWMREDFISQVTIICPIMVKFDIPNVRLLRNDFIYDSRKWCDDNCQHYWSDSAIFQSNNMSYYIWRFSDPTEAIQFKLAIL